MRISVVRANMFSGSKYLPVESPAKFFPLDQVKDFSCLV